MSSSEGKAPKPGSAKDRREKAAAARAAQEAAEKRRDRMVKLVGGLGVLLVVALIIGVAVYSKSSGDGGSASPTAAPTADPTAKLPKGVVAEGENAFAVPYGTAPASAPLLQIWEDFQCPACATVEAANGAGIKKLATEGKARLFFRPTAFLDNNLAAPNAKNNAPLSSHRAIAAWGCAIDAGKTIEFHDTVFANQPKDEGKGYTEAQLLEFGAQSGITGEAYTTFESCVKAGTYLGWAANSYKAFQDGGIQGTPAAFLNGTEVKNDVLADAAKLEAAVAEAAKA